MPPGIRSSPDAALSSDFPGTQECGRAIDGSRRVGSISKNIAQMQNKLLLPLAIDQRFVR